MKKIIKAATLLIVSMFVVKQVHSQTVSNNLKVNKMNSSSEKSAIENLLFSYRDALNASSTNSVLPLYTQDGIFMPTNAPSAVGQEQLKASYDFVFKTIQLHIEFFIDEIVLNGDYAFVRTTSKGTTLIHANGETVPEENRELFVLQKENSEWKIARYMFNKTK